MEEGIFDLFKFLGRALGLIWQLVRIIAWECLFEGIGWWIGWLFFRFISFGLYPKAPLSGQDQAPWSTALLVELVGLAILGGSALVVSQLFFN